MSCNFDIIWRQVWSFLDWRTICFFFGVLCILYGFYPFFKYRNVRIKGPLALPFFGNFLSMLYKGISKVDTECVKKFGPISRLYLGRQMDILVAEPEHIKQIMVKDFQTFVNRRSFGQTMDEPFRSFLTVIRNDHWKHVRGILTPTFSSGKLKQMVPEIGKTADKLVENIGKFAERGATFEAKELYGAYTMDVIAKIGFGLEIDSQKNPEDPFVLHAKEAFKPKIRISGIFLIVFPPLYRVLRKLDLLSSLFAKGAFDFFTDIVKRTVEKREEKPEEGKERVDLLQLMVNAHVSDAELQKAIKDKSEDVREAQPGQYWHKKGLTTAEVLAQGILVFLAGYDTTATTICFTAYELAWHQDIQQRCYEEVRQKIPAEGKVTAEAVAELQYLEKCILETLRLYPPAVRTDRQCSKETEIGGYTIPSESIVGVPIYYLHHNPDYWPEPDSFIPDRFVDGQREENTFRYLPFGAGPRNCIARRLALLEAKIAIAKTLLKYKLVVDDVKTEKRPPQLRKFGITYIQNGIHLIAVPREESQS